MKTRIFSLILALVMAFGLCVPAFAAEDAFDTAEPAAQEEEAPIEEAEDEPEPIAESDLVVLGDKSGVIGYSHIGIGSIHMFAIGLATDYVLTTNQGADVSEIQYSCDAQTGVVTGQVNVDFIGATPLTVTVKKTPGSYPTPLKISYDPIDLLKDAGTAPKYAMPGDLLLIAVKDGYKVIPDSRNFTILEDSKGDVGRVLQIRVSASARELNIKSEAPAVTPTPTPTATPTPTPSTKPTPTPTPTPTPGTKPTPAPAPVKDGWNWNNGTWTYGRNGKLVTSDWVYDTGVWYFMDPDGKMKEGFDQIALGRPDDGWYYFNEKHDGSYGHMMTGWQYIDKTWYYFNPKHNGSYGQMVANAWLYDAGVWYFMGMDGKMYEGLTRIDLGRDDDGLYYFSPSHDGTYGHVLTGWRTINGNRYYFDPNHNGYYGRAYTGTHTIAGRSYTFDSEGRLVR